MPKRSSKNQKRDRQQAEQAKALADGIERIASEFDISEELAKFLADTFTDKMSAALLMWARDVPMDDGALVEFIGSEETMAARVSAMLGPGAGVDLSGPIVPLEYIGSGQFHLSEYNVTLFKIWGTQKYSVCLATHEGIKPFVHVLNSCDLVPEVEPNEKYVAMTVAWVVAEQTGAQNQ